MNGRTGRMNGSWDRQNRPPDTVGRLPECRESPSRGPRGGASPAGRRRRLMSVFRGGRNGPVFALRFYGLRLRPRPGLFGETRPRRQGRLSVSNNLYLIINTRTNINTVLSRRVRERLTVAMVPGTDHERSEERRV